MPHNNHSLGKAVIQKKMKIFRNAVMILTVAGISLFIGYSAGYMAAPRETLDNSVEHVGISTTDKKRVLSATVESLKSESRLVSYSVVGSQHVSIDRSYWRIFNGQQQLIVPATIMYFVDLSKISEASVVFDEAANTVSVRVPKLMLSVEFDPRRASVTNSGMLTLKDSTVQDMMKKNYDTARKAAIKQGQQPELVRLAKERTKENIERLFRIPLEVAGMSDVKIELSFAN